jgi:regulator of telomere elongation helicase 1
MKQEDNLECINGYIPFPLESDYRIQINSKPMNKLQINGVDVLFPYVPYPSQEAYMNEVISSLQNESYALLESPTGTGKTLCLLCATLGYLVHCQKYKLKFCFKIIYATRTHSQISQVIKELKKTAYEPFIVIMGGRDKMCMDNKLNTSIEDANVNCHAALSHQKCKYYDSKREKKDPFYFKKVMDIYDLEDFRNYCAAYKVCHYIFYCWEAIVQRYC